MSRFADTNPSIQYEEADIGTLRADFHSHTWYSLDALTTPAQLVQRAASVGLDRIAVTDHGEIDGALEAHSLDPARVIVGEEIRCRCGTELIGLFLRERIPPGLPMEEVGERIRDQGGIVYAPHPTAYLTRVRWRAERALAESDIAEVFNSRAFLPAWNRTADREVTRRGITRAAGSDAHFPWEIGRAYTVLPEFSDAAELRAIMERSRPVGACKASPLIHVASIGVKVVRSVIHRGRWNEGGPNASAANRNSGPNPPLNTAEP